MSKNKAVASSGQSKKSLPFWVGITCVGVMLLWWLSVIFMFQAHFWFTNELAPDWPWIYEYGSLITIFILIVASAVVVPCAVWVFKGLKLKDPILAAVLLATVPLFTFALFILIVDVIPQLRYGPSPWMLPGFIASLLVPVGLYAWLFRSGPRVLSRKGTILFAIFTPFFIIALDLVYRIVMTGTF